MDMRWSTSQARKKLSLQPHSGGEKVDKQEKLSPSHADLSGQRGGQVPS